MNCLKTPIQLLNWDRCYLGAEWKKIQCTYWDIYVPRVIFTLGKYILDCYSWCKRGLRTLDCSLWSLGLIERMSAFKKISKISAIDQRRTLMNLYPQTSDCCCLLVFPCYARINSCYPKGSLVCGRAQGLLYCIK
jgi:hypothetical protein